MIITNLFGGLGNQMFQYATGKAVAARNSVQLYVDPRDMAASRHEVHNGFELSRVFQLVAPLATTEQIGGMLGAQARPLLRRILRRRSMAWLRSRSFVVEPHFRYWPGIEAVKDPAYLCGNWQSEAYFSSVAAELRRDFRFRVPQGWNDSILAAVAGDRSVSIHVRRGDYVRNPKTLKFHGVLPAQYYRDAIEYISRRIGGIEVFVFSDDIPWAREHLRFTQSTTYVTGNEGRNSYLDMYVMASCAHNVIANSSFSWWAAWLNRNPEKVVIAPRQWFAANHLDTSTLLPEGVVTL